MSSHKVVYNACYGGFSLSMEAIDWLEENGCEEVRSMIKDIKSRPSLTYDLTVKYGVSSWFDRRRHHKDLVAVVNELGDKSCGNCSQLRIAIIYSDMYRIDDYDGFEDVITPDDSQEWVFIND